MTEIVSGGQRLTVGFLTLCCVLGLLNVTRGLMSWSQSGVLFALAQTIFALFAGTAAWNVYQWKKVGWYLGFVVVVQWIGAIVNLRGEVGWLTLVLTVPMAGVGIWLYLPVVRARFGIKKAFG